MSDYLSDKGLLSMNAYYKELKAALKDAHKKYAVLEYLNNVKKQYLDNTYGNQL